MTYAICKGCEKPKDHDEMLNYDMAICLDCSYGLDAENNVLFDEEDTFWFTMGEALE